jgi:sugar/nucleoside kinase (ribokinase family)
MSGLSFDYGIAGGLSRDFTIAADGTVHLGVLGGRGAYAAAGARLWTDSVGILARIGADFPAQWLERLSKAGIHLGALRRMPLPMESRRFAAYLSEEECSFSNPATHFLRIGEPLPKDLLDFPEPPQGQPAREAYGADELRPEDLLEHDPLPRAIHLCPGSYLAHLLVPVRLRELRVRLVTLDPSESYLQPGFGSDVRSLVNGLDAFLPSFEEAQALLSPLRADVRGMAEALASAGCRFVVIKLGAGGQFVWDRDARRGWQVPAYPARVKDFWGIGDSYGGGFLVGLDQTGDVVEAALRGSVSASLTIEGPGPLYALDTLPGLAQGRLAALRPGARQA